MNDDRARQQTNKLTGGTEFTNECNLLCTSGMGSSLCFLEKGVFWYLCR